MQLLILLLLVGCLGIDLSEKYELIHYSKLKENTNAINLDTLAEIEKITCNAENKTIMVEFTTLQDKLNFIDNNPTIITSNNLCGDIFIGQVIKMTSRDAFSLEITTLKVGYTDIFEDLDIDLHPKLQQNGQGNKKICIGYNVVENCDNALENIVLYNDKYVTITCSNCYVGLSTDIFVKLKIGFFKLKELAGGFQNITLNSGMVTTFNAQYTANYIYDKVYPVIKDKTIISFNIGPIPIRIYFDIPLEIKIIAHLNTKGILTSGVINKINIGDAYISWTSDSGWKVITPSPTLITTPVLSSTGSINADANIYVIPSFNIHVNNFFWYGITLTPDLDITITGATFSKQVCLEGDIKVNLKSEGELDCNIPWVATKQIHFGPSNLYDYTKTIGKYCYK